jgi:hypothetical protein
VNRDQSASFMDQFAKSAAEVKRLKETVPHIFHEWQELQVAEDTVRKANARLVLAKQKWEAL